VIIDQETGEEMAAYRAHLLPQDFAQHLAELGRLYNNAEMAVERMVEGGTVITTLNLECQYPNIYRHKDWWKRQWQKTKEIEGFPTNQRTRPLALNRIRWFVAESPQLIHDKQFIAEALMFIRMTGQCPCVKSHCEIPMEFAPTGHSVFLLNVLEHPE
jgi:hypothetical protein